MSDEHRAERAQPNYIARAVEGVVRRTAVSISPWVRQYWQSRPSVGPVPPQRTSFGPADRSRGAAPLVMRVLRMPQTTGSTSAPVWVDRFSSSIIRRHATAGAIGHRYQVETQKALAPSGAELPLPGLPAAQVQRAPTPQPQEMSLDELAASFAHDRYLQAEPGSGDSSRVSTAGPSSFRSQPAMAELREQVRRAAMPRQSSTQPQVQRAPGQAVDPNASLVAAIEARIRDAQARQSAGEPPAGPASAEPAASSPVPPIQRAEASPGEPGYSRAAAIAERIRAARARAGAEPGSVPTTPYGMPTGAMPPAAPLPSEPPPAAPPPVQREVAEWSPAAGSELPEPLPYEPSSNVESQGYSKTAAIAERIRQARIQRAEQAPGLQTSPDPENQNYSKTAALEQRIQAAREQRASAAPLPVSTDPDSPDYSRSAALRERIAQAKAQREARTRGGVASASKAGAESGSAPGIQRTPEGGPPGAPPSDPSGGQPPAGQSGPSAASLTAQIEERIRQAQARREANMPPAAPSQAAPPSDLQRAAETRPAIVRDFKTAPSLDGGASRTGPAPQLRRVRAFSRSQVLTPERKTGDFGAGDATPQTGGTVQRTPSAPQTAPPPREIHSVDWTAVGVETEAPTQAGPELIQRSAVATPASEPGAHEPETAGTAISPSGELPATPASAVFQASGPEVQRAVEAEETVPPGEIPGTAGTAAPPAVQHTVESASPSGGEEAVAPALAVPEVQRTVGPAPAAPDVGEIGANAPERSGTESPAPQAAAPIAQPVVDDVVPRAADVAAAAAEAPDRPSAPTVQRAATPEAAAPTPPASAPVAASLTPGEAPQSPSTPTVQRSVATDAPPALTPESQGSPASVPTRQAEKPGEIAGTPASPVAPDQVQRTAASEPATAKATATEPSVAQAGRRAADPALPAPSAPEIQRTPVEGMGAPGPEAPSVEVSEAGAAPLASPAVPRVVEPVLPVQSAPSPEVQRAEAVEAAAAGVEPAPTKSAAPLAVQRMAEPINPAPPASPAEGKRDVGPAPGAPEVQRKVGPAPVSTGPQPAAPPATEDAGLRESTAGGPLAGGSAEPPAVQRSVSPAEPPEAALESPGKPAPGSTQQAEVQGQAVAPAASPAASDQVQRAAAPEPVVPEAGHTPVAPAPASAVSPVQRTPVPEPPVDTTPSAPTLADAPGFPSGAPEAVQRAAQLETLRSPRTEPGAGPAVPSAPEDSASEDLAPPVPAPEVSPEQPRVRRKSNTMTAPPLEPLRAPPAPALAPPQAIQRTVAEDLADPPTKPAATPGQSATVHLDAPAISSEETLSEGRDPVSTPVPVVQREATVVSETAEPTAESGATASAQAASAPDQPPAQADTSLSSAPEPGEAVQRAVAPQTPGAADLSSTQVPKPSPEPSPEPLSAVEETSPETPPHRVQRAPDDVPLAAAPSAVAPRPDPAAPRVRPVAPEAQGTVAAGETAADVAPSGEAAQVQRAPDPVPDAPVRSEPPGRESGAPGAEPHAPPQVQRLADPASSAPPPADAPSATAPAASPAEVQRTPGETVPDTWEESASLGVPPTAAREVPSTAVEPQPEASAPFAERVQRQPAPAQAPSEGDPRGADRPHALKSTPPDDLSAGRRVQRQPEPPAGPLFSASQPGLLDFSSAGKAMAEVAPAVVAPMIQRSLDPRLTARPAHQKSLALQLAPLPLGRVQRAGVLPQTRPTAPAPQIQRQVPNEPGGQDKPEEQDELAPIPLDDVSEEQAQQPSGAPSSPPPVPERTGRKRAGAVSGRSSRPSRPPAPEAEPSSDSSMPESPSLQADQVLPSNVAPESSVSSAAPVSGTTAAKAQAAHARLPCDDDEDANSGTGATPDLDDLARQILPMIKRMLIVERERHTFH